MSVNWSQVADASFYQVSSYQGTAPYPTGLTQLVYRSGNAIESLKVTVPAADDYHVVTVSAFAQQYMQRGLGGSIIDSSVSHTRALDVIPAATGLALSGTVTRYNIGGNKGDYAYLSTFDGVSEISNAQVSLNNAAVAFDPAIQMHALEGAAVLNAGVANALKVTLAGKADLNASVAIPGDFAINPTPASVAKGNSVMVSWSASAGATGGYQVWVVNAQGQQSFAVLTSATSISVSGFDVTGKALIMVAATGGGSDRHLMGLNQQAIEIDVTP